MRYPDRFKGSAPFADCQLTIVVGFLYFHRMTLAEYLVGKEKRAFARAIGIHPSRLSKILTGERLARETERIVIEHETGGKVDRNEDWPNGKVNK